MDHWKSWLIAATAALAGAALMHSWSTWEAGASQPAYESSAPELESPPQDESHSTPEVSHPSARVETVQAASRARQDAVSLGLLAGQNPIAMLTFEQKKTLLRNRYGALFQELDLTPSEADRLLAVLSDQETRNPNRARRERTGLPPADEAESKRARAEIAEAIGSSKAAAFEQLRASLPARFELRKLRDQLEEAGEPMTIEQHRALTDIISAQGADPPPERGASRTLEDAAERYRTWVSERNRGLRENAATILSPTQLKTLDENESLREAMRSQLGNASKGQAGSSG